MDKKSNLKFENGHESKLIAALNKGDVKSAEKLIIEIDCLLADGYAEFPQTMQVGTNLRFRIGQALTENFYKIYLSKFGGNQPLLIINNQIRYYQKQKNYKISIEEAYNDLNQEQETIWEQIQ